MVSLTDQRDRYRRPLGVCKETAKAGGEIMDEEKLKELYSSNPDLAKVRDWLDQQGIVGEENIGKVFYKDPYEACLDMVLSVIKQMEESGFDRTTLEELKQRIV